MNVSPFFILRFNPTGPGFLRHGGDFLDSVSALRDTARQVGVDNNVPSIRVRVGRKRVLKAQIVLQRLPRSGCNHFTHPIQVVQ